MADQKYALLCDYTFFSGNHGAEIATKEELELPLHQWGIKEVQVGPFRLAAIAPANVLSLCRSRNPVRCTTALSMR